MKTEIANRGDKLPANVVADRVVSRLREAEKALQQATTIHQAKVIGDMAAAQEVFAHRQKLGDEVIGYAHQIKIEALSRLGELLRQMPKAGPQHSRGGGSKGSKREPLPSAPATYADLGIDKKTALDYNKRCDFIAYAIVPASKCYLFPFELLRQAFAMNRSSWVRKHRMPPTQNHGYQTINVAVPVAELKAAIWQQMHRSFGAQIELPKAIRNGQQIDFAWSGE